MLIDPQMLFIIVPQSGPDHLADHVKYHANDGVWVFFTGGTVAQLKRTSIKVIRGLH